MTGVRMGYEVLKNYLLLSKEGKCYLHKSIAKSRRSRKGAEKTAAFNLRQTHYFLRTLRVCDRVFAGQVSRKLCAELGWEQLAMYARFVTYGWFCLMIWGKILDAFGVAYDERAEERCVLAAFTHREWNDLSDLEGYSFKELCASFDYQVSIPQAMTFLRKLKQLETRFAPPERFGRYYRHMEGFAAACGTFEYTPEKAEIVLTHAAPFIARVFMYLMVPEIPEGLEETLPAIARWLYMLDELADLEQDKKNNRITYMHLVADPEKALQDQFEQCRQIITRNAGHPEKLLKFMGMITSRVIQARKNRADVENGFFNIC